MDEDTSQKPPEEERRIRAREAQARHRARKRGEDVPLRKKGGRPPRTYPLADGVKICIECEQEKPSKDFYLVKKKEKPDRLHSYCKDCCARRSKASREANPDDNRDRCKTRYWADPEATRQKAREYRQQNLDRIRGYDRSRRSKVKAGKLLQKYGISRDDYDRLRLAQGGVCAICGQENDLGYELVIDHDHDTGNIRGLLCRKCNLGMGCLRDDRSLLEAAIRYLDDPPAPKITGGDKDNGNGPLREYL